MNLLKQLLEASMTPVEQFVQAHQKEVEAARREYCVVEGDYNLEGAMDELWPLFQAWAAGKNFGGDEDDLYSALKDEVAGC